MKHFVFAAFAAILLAGCKDDAPSAHTETTPGGIEYTRLYIPDAEYVALQVAWPSDWAFREDVNQAVPYIGADLILAGGATGFPAGQVIETFADLKAEGHLSVTAEHIFGTLMAPEEHLEKVVKIANAHLLSPALDQGWFERIRDGFADNMAEATAQPASKGFNALRWAVLGDTPLRRSRSVDPPEMITDATRDDIAAWHRENFTRSGAMIVIAGATEADKAGAAIDALMTDLPAGKPHPAKQSRADFAPRRILLHIPDATTSTLAFIAPMPPTRDGGEFEDIILASQLGGSDQSVLFDAVRTQLRASYGFGAGLDGYTRDTRLLVLTGEVETDKVAQAEMVVRDAYADFRETGVEGSVDDLKAPLMANAEQATKDPWAASFTALLELLDGQEPGLTFELAKILGKVSKTTLNDRLTNTFPAANAFITLAVSPDANALPGACVITAPAQAVNCR